MNTARLNSVATIFITGVFSLSGISCATGNHASRKPSSVFPLFSGTTEGGALPLDEEFQSVSRQGGAQTIAYQVESYGGTTLAFHLNSVSGQPVAFTVTGPWVDLGGAPQPHPATITPSGGNVVLTQPGVYRMSATNGEFSGTVSCEKACSRPSVSASAYFQELKAAGKIGALSQIVNAELASVVSDPTLRAAFSAQLQTILASGDYSKLDRFPVIDLADLKKVAIPLASQAEHAQRSAPVAAPLIHDDLNTLLGSCDTARVLPGVLSPALPGVMYGNYNNMAMSDCQYDRSTKLAAILTSLASGNNSVVSYQGQDLTTPSALVNALIQSGHHVEMRNERTYADFLSFMIGDPADPNSRTMKWPTWVKTGVTLNDGPGATPGQLIVPMGHSQHFWHITGPLVNANITFYLGVSGAGFFAQTNVRAAWTGLRTLYKLSTDNGDTATILKALDYSGTYLKRILYESSHVAQSYPAEGYGYLGVCNDSTALLEYLYQGSVSEYPLVRERELLNPVKNPVPLDPANDLEVKLDAALKILPADANQIPSPKTGRGKLSILSRVAQMTPYPLDSPDMIDEAFRAVLVEVLKENSNLTAKFQSSSQ